ncbi:MAG: hypothetical protein R3190_12555 [Thermoanaerobaculia bacterium]|nr:hypothetical protein [Thermoanaerobaculia bacterium]
MSDDATTWPVVAPLLRGDPERFLSRLERSAGIAEPLRLLARHGLLGCLRPVLSERPGDRGCRSSSATQWPRPAAAAGAGAGEP